MSVEVVMPQMGESIAEGTVAKWLKKVGDVVEKDEAILSISTDKIDAEVFAPASGTLLKINVQEGETVPVGTVLAVIGETSEKTIQSSPQVSSEDLSKADLDSAKQETEKTAETNLKQEAQPVKEASVSVKETKTADTSGFADSTEIVMPQMGESIAEGTVAKWLKKVGDVVEKDEAILSISTDKVDAEVSAPASGILLKINVQEGETVPVGTVLAVIGKESKSQAQESAETQAKSQAETKPQSEPSPEVSKAVTSQASQVLQTTKEPNGALAEAKEKEQSNGRSLSVEELRRKKSSPLVRNIAKKHGIDISKIQGTGMSGRVTKKDILAYIESGAAFKPQELMAAATVTQKTEVKPIIEQPATQPTTPAEKSAYVPPSIKISSEDRIEQMSIMRKKIAEHMVFSKRTSAHVTTVYEIDMTNVVKFREQYKEEFQARYGTKLTYMPFIFQAVIQALRKYPIFNAQVSGDQIVYKGEINLGMAVALDWGLIVPVIKRADTLSLAGLAITANDLADRARAKKLSPDEVQGGTFTITNPGVFGGLFGTPIINQPQVAILCIGVIEKRPKVITTPEGDDVIAIRQMAYFALTYDHRIIDGADAEKFLSFIKQYLETTKFSL
jgi:2-oxoglutarate dehydrogenase E2 component (dihydrolipoamide succinyltransferase)